LTKRLVVALISVVSRVSEREREKNHMEGVVFEIKESKYKQYLIPFFVIQKDYRRSILKREIYV